MWSRRSTRSRQRALQKDGERGGHGYRMRRAFINDIGLMTIEFSSRIRPTQDVLVRELDGEAVLLNLDSESYYGLNQVGARMWALVMESDSIQAAYEVLANEYEVEAKTLKDDLRTQIEEWIEHGLAHIDIE